MPTQAQDEWLSRAFALTIDRSHSTAPGGGDAASAKPGDGSEPLKNGADTASNASPPGNGKSSASTTAGAKKGAGVPHPILGSAQSKRADDLLKKMPPAD